MKSPFELVKDARSIYEFFCAIRKTEIISMNVVFLAIIDYYEIYAPMRDSYEANELRRAVSEGGSLFLTVKEAVALKDKIRTMKKRGYTTAIIVAYEYLEYVDGATMGEHVFTRLRNLLPMDCEEDVLPHLKLALAYCEWTN